MRAKGFSIGLLIGILLLGVSVAFGQDAADVITTANAAKLKQIMKIEDKDKELNELGMIQPHHPGSRQEPSRFVGLIGETGAGRTTTSRNYQRRLLLMPHEVMHAG